MKILVLVLSAFLFSGCPHIQYRVGDPGIGMVQVQRHHVARSSVSADGIFIEVGGSTPYERERVRKLANSLNFINLPSPNWWRIIILNEPDWQDALVKYHLEGSTGSAFTIMGQDITYLREEYLEFGVDERVRFTLAHEFGHLSCRCSNEDRANEVARQMVK